MKTLKVLKTASLGVALFVATSAFASHKGDLHVRSVTDVAGSHLAAGDYRVQWDGDGPDVTLHLMQGNHVMANVPAKLVPLDDAPRYDAAVVDINPDGSRRLLEIRFSGKRYGLQIDQSSESTNSKSGSPSINAHLPADENH